MSKAKPLTAEQCEAAREAMLTGHSLSKISRCAGVVATIEYMLKDIRLLETYLQRMASAITQKREQISHSALLLSMFHYEMSSLSLLRLWSRNVLSNGNFSLQVILQK